MDSKPANSVNYDRQLDDESASECELKIDIPSSEPDAILPTSDDQQKTQLGSDSQRESIDSGTFSEQEEETGSMEIDVEASDDVSTNSLPTRKDSSIQANSYDTATSAQSAPRLHRRDSRFFITRWPTYLHPPFELSNYRLAVPNYIEHYIAAMSSAATAVQVPATMLARASSTPYSPAHSPHSNGLHVPEESAGSDKPLDFSSKPNSAASKTPPSSEEEELAISSRGGPAPPRIDPITLTKSLAAAAAASAYFPSHPKYIKNEHCFSTPSPSPPERTQHHFGLSVSGDAQSPHGPSTPMAANPEDHAAAAAAATNATAALANAQMFGLLSQFASAAQQHPNPMLSPALANQSTLLKAIQLASGGSSQQHQQQAALLSALMQSGANLELLKSLTAGATAPTMHQPQQSSPKLASPVATSNHPGAFLMAAQPATTTTVTPSHMSPAMGLLSTARHGAGYHHQSGPLSPPTSSAPVVEHSSNVFRSSPPSTVASNAKYTRPFKALYSGKDSFHAQSPFTPSIGLASAAATAPSVATDSLATQSILLSNSDLAYQEFRNKMLLSKTRTNERERNSSTHQTRASAGRDGKMAELMHQHSDDNHSVASSNSSDGLDCVSAGSDSQHQQHHFSTAASVSFPASSSSISIATSSSQMAHSTPQSATTAPTTPVNTCNGSASSTGSNSGRKRGRPLPDDLKDEAYWERRRKNNEAAKRSRDLRRAKEDEIAIRAAFLEQENFKLKCELVQARIECDKIRALWLNTQQGQAAAAAGAQLSPSTITADQATLAAMLQMKTAGSPK